MFRFNYDKLRGRMAEKGYSQKKLADKLGIHANTMAHKMYCDSYFTVNEVQTICKYLDIRPFDIPMYFFTLY